MRHLRRVTAAAVVLAVLAPGQPATAKDEPPVAAMRVATHVALAGCPEVVFIKRHHIRRPFGIGTLYAWNCYSPGGGIYAFDPRYPERPHREIFRRDEGVVFNIELSYDARKILFSWMSMAKDARDSFHIYEIDTDGQHLRQLTTGRYHDVSATYLPDGSICFVSTRSECYSMCQPAPGCALFTMSSAGQDMRRIEFNTLGDYAPAVMTDGSILFMRWEYNDRSLFTRQKLWTIKPDGTSLRLYYGNTLTSPNVLWQARQIPGSEKVICTMAPHYGTVPVENDGSACFNAPTGVELYFEALDASGKELSRMTSLTQIMPGEVQGCVGCHEPRDSSSSPSEPLAMRHPPVDITPPPWGAGPVDFVRQVQPVLDRYCVTCHSGPNPRGIDLSNDKTRFFNMAYNNLTVPKWVDFYWVNSAGSATLKPLALDGVASPGRSGPAATFCKSRWRSRGRIWIRAIPGFGNPNGLPVS